MPYPPVDDASTIEIGRVEGHCSEALRHLCKREDPTTERPCLEERPTEASKAPRRYPNSEMQLECYARRIKFVNTVLSLIFEILPYSTTSSPSRRLYLGPHMFAN